MMNNKAWMDFANLGRQFFITAIRYMELRIKQMEKESESS